MQLVCDQQDCEAVVRLRSHWCESMLSTVSVFIWLFVLKIKAIYFKSPLITLKINFLHLTQKYQFLI